MKKLILFAVCILSYTSVFAKESDAKKTSFSLANTTCSLKIKSATTPEMTDIKFAVANSLILGKVRAAQYMDGDVSYSAVIMGDVLKKDPSTMILGAEVTSTNMKTGDYAILKGAIVMTNTSRSGLLHFNSVPAQGIETAVAVTCEVAK